MKLDPGVLRPMEAYKLMIGAIVPRAIAWVSTVGENGVLNLAPFSFFTGVCSEPPIVCFCPVLRMGQKKDTLRNVEYSEEFVVNIVNEELAERMNITSTDFPPEISEFERTGLTPVASEKVKPPRIGESPISMECKLVQIVYLGGQTMGGCVVLGQVVQFHIKDELHYDTAKIDQHKLRAIGRMAGDMYCRTSDIFEMKRPRYVPSEGAGKPS